MKREGNGRNINVRSIGGIELGLISETKKLTKGSEDLYYRNSGETQRRRGKLNQRLTQAQRRLE